jgi:hypothetical protein
VIELTEQERDEQTQWSTSLTLAAGDVFKAKLILALSNDTSYSRIQPGLKIPRPTIARPEPPPSTAGFSSTHAHMLFLTQSGGTLVRKDPARCHRPRYFHFGHRSLTQVDEIHFALMPKPPERSAGPTHILPVESE